LTSHLPLRKLKIGAKICLSMSIAVVVVITNLN
jgi:hypothetical protein